MVLVMTIFVFNQSKETLTQAKFDKLTAAEIAKPEEITGYFNSLGKLLIPTALNKGIKDAFNGLEDGLHRLKNENDILTQ